MPQSLSNVLVHLVFSTKERHPFLADSTLRVAAQRYLTRQEAHHCRVSFQDELRTLLDRHRIAYDERYLWD